MHPLVNMLIVLILFLFSVVSGEAESIKDRRRDLCYFPKGEHVDCRNMELRKVPLVDNPENISKVLLPNNKITSLRPGDVTVYSSVEVLDVSYNRIRSISSRTFAGLTMLEEVRLDHNFLRAISKDMFLSNPSLLKIGFKKNLFSSITESFLISNSIKEIDLGDNKRIRISNKTFAALPQLAAIRLTSCSLDASSFKVLNDLVRTHDVDLRGNDFPCECRFANLLQMTKFPTPMRCIASGTKEVAYWDAKKIGSECASLIEDSITTLVVSDAPLLQELKLQSAVETTKPPVENFEVEYTREVTLKSITTTGANGIQNASINSIMLIMVILAFILLALFIFVFIFYIIKNKFALRHIGELPVERLLP